jgi:hypothetical protein
MRRRGIYFTCMLVIFFALTPSLALAIDRGYIEWVYCPTSAKVGSYIEFKVKVTCISKSNINQPWKAILCVDYNGDKNGEDWPASCQPDIYILNPVKAKSLLVVLLYPVIFSVNYLRAKMDSMFTLISGIQLTKVKSRIEWVNWVLHLLSS